MHAGLERVVVAARLSVEVWVISLVVFVNWRGKWRTRRRKGFARVEDAKKRDGRRSCEVRILKKLPAGPTRSCSDDSRLDCPRTTYTLDPRGCI